LNQLIHRGAIKFGDAVNVKENTTENTGLKSVANKI